MPKNETLMRALTERYGEGKAEQVYWGMAGEGKGPFGPRGKYRAEHKAIAKLAGEETKGKKPQGRGKKKPRAGGGRATRGKGYRRKR